jgi:hypothetical protein
VGPRAGPDRCGKSRPPPGFDPLTVQPVASRYTDCATRPTSPKRIKRVINTVFIIMCQLQYANERIYQLHYVKITATKVAYFSEVYSPRIVPGPFVLGLGATNVTCHRS